MSDLAYMDHHATTPVDRRVVEAMLPFFTETYGNAASRTHALGWAAEDAVGQARQQVADLIGARPKEIVWTSGATESDNLALKGIFEARKFAGHLVTTQIEHKAVLDSARHLARLGVAVTYVEVDGDGRVDPSRIASALREDTALVSVMSVNNEVGTIQPIAEIAKITRAHGAALHVDAAQGLGMVPLRVDQMEIDLLSLSAHKMYGPKGVGALYVRSGAPRVRLTGQMDGGGHERGLRSGTLNVPGIVGMGHAAAIAMAEGPADRLRLEGLRNTLRDELVAGLGDAVQLNGPREGRHPANLNVSFEYVDSESLMLSLKDVVAVSSGSACTSASVEPSYVLRAMGIDEARAHASIRFGLGRGNTAADVERVADAVIAQVIRLREENPEYRLRARGIETDW